MKNFMLPPIPRGFRYVSGTWDKAFIIEDEKNGNCFTWIPLGVLNKNDEYLTKLSLEGSGTSLEFVQNMFNKYGGIYVSTYMIGQSRDNKAISISGSAWTNISFRIAKVKAQVMSKDLGTANVRTQLLHAIEYDEIVKTVAYLAGKSTELLSDEHFREYGLYGMNDLWSWTLTNHGEFSIKLKKAASQNEEVYASNEFFNSSKIGFRITLTVF